QALVITPGTEPLLRIACDPYTSTFRMDSFSISNGNWTLHATGSFHPLWKGYTPPKIDLETLRKRFDQEIPVHNFYALFATQGMQYGPAFQLIESIYHGAGEALSLIQVPFQEDFLLYPPFFDAALQTLLGTTEISCGFNGLILPVHIDEVHYYAKPQ